MENHLLHILMPSFQSSSPFPLECAELWTEDLKREDVRHGLLLSVGGRHKALDSSNQWTLCCDFGLHDQRLEMFWALT